MLTKRFKSKPGAFQRVRSITAIQWDGTVAQLAEFVGVMENREREISRFRVEFYRVPGDAGFSAHGTTKFQDTDGPSTMMAFDMAKCEWVYFEHDRPKESQAIRVMPDTEFVAKFDEEQQ